MPRNDGTGPMGGGPGSGGGGGRGQGPGRGAGPGGSCVCPNCGEKAAHRRSTPCVEMKCPKCGTYMTRG